MSNTLLFRPDLGKKGYRMKCRFKIEPHPTRDRLKQGALAAWDLFVTDMAKQGWEYLSSEAPRFRGPFAPTAPMNVHRLRVPTSQQMMAEVAQGARFLAGKETIAQSVLALTETEYWEYELALVFVRPVILMDVPDRHEEMVGSRW